MGPINIQAAMIELLAKAKAIGNPVTKANRSPPTRNAKGTNPS